MDNKDFFEWYRRKITENPQDPPADAWQNIADELDTNDVWDKVAARLDDRGRWFYQKPWNYALPALLFLLLSTGGYLIYDKAVMHGQDATTSTYAPADTLSREDHVAGENSFSDAGESEEETSDWEGTPDETIEPSHDENANITSRQNPAGGENILNRIPLGGKETSSAANNLPDQDETRASHPDKNISDTGERAERPEKGWIDKTSSKEKASDIDTGSIDIAVSSEERSTEEKTLLSTQRLVYQSIDIRRIIMPDSMLNILPLLLAVDHNSAGGETVLPPALPLFSRSLEFGISGAVKNTWLLNQTTFMGLERHTLTTTLPDFGKDIGVTMRYNFAPRFSMQAEVFIISGMGQRYNEYRKGKYIEREVDLNYFHANILFKYGNNTMQLDRLVNGHGIIGGLYFSKLTNASETIDGQTTDFRDAYAPTDYGMVIGYEYNQHLFSNFFFTSGVRLNYGLKNIRPGTGSKTATGSFDVDFALRYRF